ncbi:MAG: Uma2 family endonuclease [Prochloron sp. SP5CPC1]|nr:Uma2 family endonuclease [Candidatus Paraprochloron terpiosi SP5CPC1]
MIYLPTTLELELNVTDEQFWTLCHKHTDLRFERSAKGDLIIMPPTGGLTSHRNSDITFQLELWSRKTKLGKVFDSSGGFKLPNGANRFPDAAWIKIERWNNLTPEEKEKFLPLCPDFVVELRSPNDSLQQIQMKMAEYRANGARLGWLIDPKRKVVEVYRPGIDVEVLQNPTTVSGEDVLPGFQLDLTEIWGG